MRRTGKKRKKGELRPSLLPPPRERARLLALASRPAAFGLLARASRRRQRDVLCDVMLSASQCDSWLTLDELAMLTHYPPASISARLRHLRKREFGGYKVEKRQRLAGRILQGEDFGTVWEYRVQRRVRRIRRRSANATNRSAQGHRPRQPPESL